MKNSLRGSRWLGLLGIIGFIWSLWTNSQVSTWRDCLWICNVSSFSLGIGIFIRSPGVVWGSLLWILIGTPLWLVDMFYKKEFLWHSILVHPVGIATGLYVVSGTSKDQTYWRRALVAFITFQMFCRYFVDQEFNINLSARPYEEMAPLFPNYLSYWLFNLLWISLAMSILEKILSRVLCLRLGKYRN